MSGLIIIRPPHTYRYNKIDVREEAIISYFLGYLAGIEFDRYRVYDFHLDRTLDIATVIGGAKNKKVVITCRETGDNVFYALRIAHHLLISTGSKVFVYGQSGRLVSNQYFKELVDTYGERIELVIHSERVMAEALGLDASGPSFETDLVALPYWKTQNIDGALSVRLKASIETTRGCHYPCAFCFINASKNYPFRWSRRGVEQVICDIRTYYGEGVRQVVFNDSEFFGANKKDYELIDNLLKRIILEFPGLTFKIYSRADTILGYGDLELLKRAGLSSVFIGVESLRDQDLLELKKKTTSASLERAIASLAEAGIYMDLSFILFNRNTTFDSIAENIVRIESLYKKNSRYLGMPFFSFSFESAWSERSGSELSQRTYVALDMAIKSPGGHGSIFNPQLESLMEIYRLLSYEWSAKVTELNLLRIYADKGSAEAIESWFVALPYVCIEIMKIFLSRARVGELSLDTLGSMRDDLYKIIEVFYKKTLPLEFSECLTYVSHASLIDYNVPVALLEPDEYWYDVIPPIALADQVNRRISVLEVGV
ncbi:B12-binding domain-containing radical SAM protein [Pseudomonas syringae]|uniref:B12-binding domain-containing radical SAM protein n=1 Tax=Pseudomonas syringae TaxID=317 RepID=UPI001929C1ED|nr:radical SAM protein [Pseudomonas syringae]